jgi:hypothetical protein
VYDELAAASWLGPWRVVDGAAGVMAEELVSGILRE